MENTRENSFRVTPVYSHTMNRFDLTAHINQMCDELEHEGRIIVDIKIISRSLFGIPIIPYIFIYSKLTEEKKGN